ncbi:MAG: PaaI family thioesterase [Alphaproteobacteria bacterium]
MDTGEEQASGWVHKTVESGEWAGWSYYNADPFEDHAGPYYYRKDENGQPVCAFRTEYKHMNGGNFLHGGAIMTFADYAIFVIARDALQDGHSVTASFNGDFVGAVPLGALVECRGEVVRNARSMVFVRGLITSGADPVMNFSAIIKKTRPRS